MNIDRDEFASAQPEHPNSNPAVASSRPIEAIVQEIYALAAAAQGDPIELLHILRALEQSHRTIQTDYFQLALPDSRQALYALLRNIEENGGWPYIQRWRLQSLLANLPEHEQ